MPKKKGEIALKARKLLEEEYLQQIEQLGSLGFTLPMVGLFFGIEERSFRRYRTQFPQITDRFNKGKVDGVNKVALTAMRLASSGKDPQTTRWWLEKMAPKMMQEVNEELGQDQGTEEQQKISKQALLEAIEKDQFIDVTPEKMDNEIDNNPEVIDPLAEKPDSPKD